MHLARLFTILAIPGALACSTHFPVDTVKGNTGKDATQFTQGEQPVAGARSPGKDNRLLVCFGDSLTAGAGVEPNEAYPAYLQQRLDRSGYAYHVVNEGVSGNTTKDGLTRLQSVVERHPEVVVVEFGGNDGLRGLPIAQSQRNLDTIVQTLQASGAKVAIAGITLPPQYGGEYIHNFNAMFPTVAHHYRVPLLPFVLQDVYGVPGDIQEDGIHATAKGNQQVAINVEKLVLPLLKK